jgi:hypothetical protein
LTGAGFVQGLVLGQIAHPQATRHQLHQKVLYAGDQISCQGLDQRFTAEAAEFLKAMLAEALHQEAVRQPVVAGLLGRFNGVWIVDSTVSDQGYKILTWLNLSNGQINLEIVPPTVHDNRVELAHTRLPAGSLKLGDLGFFDLDTLADYKQQDVFWISRYKATTKLFSAQTGQELDIPALFSHQETLYLPVLVGAKKKLKAYLVIRRSSDETAHNRQQRRAYRAKRKQQVLSQKTLALAHWEVYLTNVPDFTIDEICALARARWQIELVFKLWKSFFGLELSQSADVIRQTCLFYAKLLALWLVHVLMTLDAHVNRSWWQAAQTLRDHAISALYALISPDAWYEFLLHLKVLLPLTSRLSKRKAHPLTHQLLVPTS